MQYLLDTNIVSDSIQNPFGKVAKRITAEGRARVCVSILVAAELRFGAAKRRSRSLATRIEQMLEFITVVPFAEPADRYYGHLRAALERDGLPIGGNDLLIAAHALALDCTLVTNNEREFARVASLKIENWLR
jgi:tRNA(fMet)-specific endonuclease VapC